MKNLFYAILFLSVSAAQGVNIIDLHHNTAQGEPAAPYQIGTAVEIEGIVTCGTGIYSSSNFEIYVQDETAGINAFQYQSMPASVKIGDRVHIAGKVAQYRGLTEVSDISSVQVIERNVQPPEPMLLTCQDVDQSFGGDFSEPNEGRLIRINDVSVIAGSGPVYTLQDASGQCLLYLDPDTKLDPPQGQFSVIGILKQYDSTAPYTEGYEISPRFASDFILGDGPVFISQPQEKAIAQGSVTIEWQTKEPASAEVYWAKYGAPLPSTGSVVQEQSIHHEYELQGLQPATIYHLVVKAIDNAGERRSRELIFCTASVESSGHIEAYFSKSVDRSVQWKTAAHGQMDLSTIIIQRLNAANYSIDAALYNLTHDKIFQALFLAKKRGVHVRVIYESENANDNIQWLKDAGIPVISDTFGSNNGSGYMHNKFYVIDARDTTTGADDWVITGSANASYYGTVNNAENLVAINDQSLAAAYMLEFNEMWGSSTDTPDASASRMGSRKLDNTPHRFSINGMWVEQYMSPSDKTENHIIDAINTADKGLFFCIFSFTSDAIENAMKSLYLRDPAFILRGVFDAGSVNNTGTPYDAMRGVGANAWSRAADVWTDRTDNSLHHKYLLVDGPFRDSNPILITGSHNWSYSAENRNDENTLIIHDADLVNQYYQEFSARYKEAGGSGDVTVKVQQKAEQPASFGVMTNFPNPFNGHTTIRVKGRNFANWNEPVLVIHDMTGRTVDILSPTLRQGGELLFRWNGKDEAGLPVASGIYIATLAAQGSTTHLKMLYLR